MWVEGDWENSSPDDSLDGSEEAPVAVAERQNKQKVSLPSTSVRQRAQRSEDARMFNPRPARDAIHAQYHWMMSSVVGVVL
ncbi:hypothetical protein TKK_0015505 [Trichogramma kaykai]